MARRRFWLSQKLWVHSACYSHRKERALPQHTPVILWLPQSEPTVISDLQVNSVTVWLPWPAPEATIHTSERVTDKACLSLNPRLCEPSQNEILLHLSLTSQLLDLGTSSVLRHLHHKERSIHTTSHYLSHSVQMGIVETNQIITPRAVKSSKRTSLYKYQFLFQKR